MKKITDDVLEVLASSRTEGSILYLPQRQLDRPLYEAVNKVLVAAGGKWNRGKKGHVFDGDAAELIEPVILTGEYSNKKQDFGQFETPDAVVQEMCRRAQLCRGLLCMEPSAGKSGRLAMPMLDADPKCLDCYEIDLASCQNLIGKMAMPKKSFTVTNVDFLKVIPFPKYDLVMMNPPFARGADVDHVDHALKFLNTDGALLAIMSAGITFRTDRKTTALRERILSAGQIEPLPENSFKESGTSVNTVIVTVEAR